MFPCPFTPPQGMPKNWPLSERTCGTFWFALRGGSKKTLRLITCCICWCVTRNPDSRSVAQSRYRAICLYQACQFFFFPVICLLYAKLEFLPKMWLGWRNISNIFLTFVCGSTYSNRPVRMSNYHWINYGCLDTMRPSSM